MWKVKEEQSHDIDLHVFTHLSLWNVDNILDNYFSSQRVFRHHAIIWVNVDPVLCRHIYVTCNTKLIPYFECARFSGLVSTLNDLDSKYKQSNQTLDRYIQLVLISSKDHHFKKYMHI